MDETQGILEAFYLLLFLLPIIILILRQIRTSSSNGKSLPPGPTGWPILGNILQVGTQAHSSTAQMAQIHGPLISLKLGSQLLIIGSTAEVAAEILKANDRVLSGRHVIQGVLVRGNDVNHFSLIFTDCNDRWKYLRATCRAGLFSAQALESHASLRERKVSEMVEFLNKRKGMVVELKDVVFVTIFNSLSHLFYSKDVLSLEDEEVGSDIKRPYLKLLELGLTPNIGDFYPMLARFDLQGLNKKGAKLADQLYDALRARIQQRRDGESVHEPNKQDFLDLLLANGFSDEEINSLFSVSSVLLVSVHCDSINERDICELPYLQALAKETMRLHPPAPFLVPRRALETCQVMNYTVPKGAQVLVNIWAIGRDSTTWEDPLIFNPDRFLKSNVDFKGNNFHLLPFGAGRRICPGLPLAVRQVPLVLASLLHYFDWSLPNNEDPMLLDTSETLTITLRKKQPLLLVPK
ncbi:Cytochrome P450 [Dillenia turbinata]|uniref:Cytochrome P450 n=1 Tax=Dillenia turbinata TaxID=194707 RepID=A0AAN8VRZ5_9MAGN